ncbi:MATE family efflux transporter [Desulfobaculum bizertense]|uniref:MATE family efflux transporter n=1 Tax=Desulfobaculum bizertense TaxID=376490 RepID=UPI001F394F96|nr:MATE family efflux transporter [Desulfobaculum bizertense]UIJ37578.1 MATE family efflux transporter [Desulfobaculum bizertense]
MPTEKASYRAIWNLSWPQILMMFFHFWVGFIDVYVAGKLNREVQASLGLITNCLFFLLIIAQSVANGAVAAVSQSMGAELRRRAQRYIGLCMELALLGGVAIMGVGLLFRDELLLLLQVPPEIQSITSEFLGVYALLLPSYYLLLITNAVFRARKEVMLPLFAMILITVVNTAADFGLGLGMWGLPRMGYRGLAWATFWSVMAGSALNLFQIWRKGLLTSETFPPMRWIRSALPYLYKVAWPAGLMQVLWQTGYLVLFAIVARLPVENISALAGMTVGLRVEAVLFLPGVAFNMTASVLVGNALGAGNPDLARRYGFQVWGVGVVGMSLVTMIVWQYIPELCRFMTPDLAVQPQMADYLFYNLIAIPFTLTSIIIGGALNGAGATWYPMWIFGFTVWCFRLPMAWYLGHEIMQSSTGVWISQLSSQVVQAALLLGVFAYGNWQRFGLMSKRKKNGKSA